MHLHRGFSLHRSESDWTGRPTGRHSGRGRQRVQDRRLQAEEKAGGSVPQGNSHPRNIGSRISLNDIVGCVADEAGITPARLITRDRTHQMTAWRGAAIYLAREKGYTWAEIAEVIQRDQSSCTNGFNRISEMMRENSDVWQSIENMRAKL